MRFFTLLIVLIFTLCACQSNSSSDQVLDAAQIEATDSVVAVSVKPTQHLVPAEAQHAASKPNESIHQPINQSNNEPINQLMNELIKQNIDSNIDSNENLQQSGFCYVKNG